MCSHATCQYAPFPWLISREHQLFTFTFTSVSQLFLESCAISGWTGLAADHCNASGGRAEVQTQSQGLNESTRRMSTARAASHLCYAEKAEQGQQHLGTRTKISPAADNCKKQCRPNQTKPNTIMPNPCKRHDHPTHSSTPICIKAVTTHVPCPPWRCCSWLVASSTC